MTPSIRSLIGLSSFRPLQTFHSSTPGDYHDASPKAISERTSYYQVRLAFHSLPQLIREFCTIHRFGPPSGFNRSSSWPWQAHLASGLSCTLAFAHFFYYAKKTKKNRTQNHPLHFVF